MAILCDKSTRLLVQGLGRMGQFHAKLSREYGTQVVAGVSPGKSGVTQEGMPVFDTVREAVKETGANASVIFVPSLNSSSGRRHVTGNDEPAMNEKPIFLAVPTISVAFLWS